MARAIKVWNSATASWEDVGVVAPDTSAFIVNSLVENTGLQFADGSASAPSVSNVGDTNTGIFFPDDDTVAITTGGTERTRITSSGQVIVGHTSALNVSGAAGTEGLQILGTGGASQTAQARFSADTAPPAISFAKSRGTTIGTNTIVSNADVLGRINFNGADGSGYVSAARIDGLMDGTPGVNDMPGRLSFLTTADGSGSLTERMRIDNAGLITGTGTSLGAWTSYTPTLTGITIGNGTRTAGYMQIGKLVVGFVKFVFGSTSSVTGNIIVPGPLAPKAGDNAKVTAIAYDTGVASYPLIPEVAGQDFYLRAMNASGTYVSSTATSATVPFSWGNGDIFQVQFVYEVA